MTEHQNGNRNTPTLIAVGGGKGGVGKSIVSLMLGQWLARMGHTTTIVDLDLSGANLHTLLGIKEAPTTLNDVLDRRAGSLEEIALTTEVPKLRAICGASEVLSSANPVFAQKLKLMRSLFQVESEFLVLDLGAGTSFNVLDFFLLADLQIVVTTSEPTAIYNAYGLMRNAVFRRLSQLTRRHTFLKEMVLNAMDPQSGGLRTAQDVYRAISQQGGPELLEPIRSEMTRIRPSVLLNRMVKPRERLTFGILREVAAKYLALELSDLGVIAEDQELRSMIARMIPLTRGGGYRGAWEDARRVARQVLLSLSGPGDEDTDEGTPEPPASIARMGQAG